MLCVHQSSQASLELKSHRRGNVLIKCTRPSTERTPRVLYLQLLAPIRIQPQVIGRRQYWLVLYRKVQRSSAECRSKRLTNKLQTHCDAEPLRMSTRFLWARRQNRQLLVLEISSLAPNTSVRQLTFRFYGAGVRYILSTSCFPHNTAVVLHILVGVSCRHHALLDAAPPPVTVSGPVPRPRSRCCCDRAPYTAKSHSDATQGLDDRLTEHVDVTRPSRRERESTIYLRAD